MDYYERYWKRSFGQNGVAASPPSWNEKDLIKITDIAKPYCYGNVLDIGCGDGTFTSYLSKFSKVKKITGVDISQNAISQAKRKYPEIEFKVVSQATLPFSKESFDFITMVEVVEHIMDTEQIFKEANKILKPGGCILITTTDFNLAKKIIVAAFFWGKYFYPTNPHIRFFTKATLKDILDKTGFKAIKHKWNGSYLGLMPKGQIMIAKKPCF
ncbi:class I SAM-dependent methyltransferase [bacterium]|nr:class I SAM-dependent methyltransferase [bacterium]